MAVTIGRTAWTDDDGTGTTGTVLNAAVKTGLYDQIDTALALLIPLAGSTAIGGALVLAVNDTGALGASGLGWSDLFLANGGVINWNAGNTTLTHSSGLLTLGGDFTASGTIRAKAGAGFFDDLGLKITGSWPTSGAAANAVVGANDYIRISTSSRRYKHDIQPLNAARAVKVVRALRPVTYRAKTDVDQRLYPGLIAEEVATIDRRLVSFERRQMRGRPQSVLYDRISAYLILALQAIDKRVATIERKGK